MNKQQIKAELRRSACEDKSPYFEVWTSAWFRAICFLQPHEDMWKSKQIRTFFLLVAEAL